MDVGSIRRQFPGYAGWNDEAAILADFRATGGQGKGPSTPSAPSAPSFQMPDFSAILRQQEEARLKKEAEARAAEEGFLGRFRGAIAGQETLPVMAERLGKELGLPNLRETAFGLTQSLKQTPQVQTQATRGFDVNANQLKRIIAQKQSELAPAAQEAISQQQFAEGQLGTRLGYETAQQQRQLLPLQQEASMLSDRVAREITGFNQGLQRELDTILAKLQANIQISEGEKNRAHQLALKEQEFENQKTLLAEKAKYEKPESKLLTLGEGTTVFDPVTGRAIYTSPKTYAPKTGGGGSNDPLGLFG